MSLEGEQESIRRRSVVKGLATMGIVGVAGCSSTRKPGQSQDDQNTPTSSNPPQSTDSAEPTDSPEAVENELTVEESLDLDYLSDAEVLKVPEISETRNIERTYEQYAGSTETTATLYFNEGLYDYYSQKYRMYVDNPEIKYGAYVSETLDRKAISRIVDQFENYGSEYNQSEYEIVNHIISFVQRLKYTDDEIATGYNDYPKFPMETLVEQDGDCEDSAILMVSLLRGLGYDTILLEYPSSVTPEGEAGHMAVGLAGDDSISGTYYEADDGTRYYYVEPTAPGWDIGEIPDDLDTTYFHPVSDQATLSFATTISNVQDNEVSTDSFVINTGQGATNSAQLEVELVTDAGVVKSRQTTDRKSILPGDVFDGVSEEDGVEFSTLHVLSDKNPLKLRVSAYVGGSLVARGESETKLPGY